MSEWLEVTLGELATIKGGKRLPKGSQLSEEPTLHPYIRTTDISNHKIRVEELLFVPNDVFPSIKNYIVDAGDLIISIVGTIGSCAIIPRTLDKASLTENCAKIVNVDESKLNKQFLYYFFVSEDGQAEIESRNVGSTQPKLPLYNIAGMPLVLPPLEEQKAIASVLSSLDDKIDLLHRQNTTLESMAETLFRQWFVEETQEDWEEVKLGDFVEMNKRSINKAYPFNHIEYLDTGSLTEGKIESLQSYSIKEAPSRALRLVEHNDVLISTVRPNQKHYGIINNPIENLVVSSGFCVLTCTIISPHFVYLLLTNNEMTEFLHSIAEGSTSTYPSLKPADLAAITFQLPPKDKLGDFAKIANDAWGKIHQNYKQIQTLEKLRDNLLPKLLSGEVRVS